MRPPHEWELQSVLLPNLWSTPTLEVAVLMQTAASTGRVVPLSSLQPSKQPERQRWCSKQKVAPRVCPYRPVFSAFGMAPWWPQASSQLYPFGQTQCKQPEAVVELVQMSCLAIPLKYFLVYCKCFPLYQQNNFLKCIFFKKKIWFLFFNYTHFNFPSCKTW